MLFAELTAAENALEDARKVYESKVIATDEAASKSQGLASFITEEREALAAYLAAEVKLDRVKGLHERNNVGGVVSVTYKSETGAEKTFYINYNNYDVVFEANGKMYTIGAMDFVEESALVGETPNVKSSTSVDAYIASGASIVANFTSANDALNDAIASGSQFATDRALTKVKSILVDATITAAGEVAKVENASGGFIYINYTSGNVIVKISDTRYELISAQSYLIVE